MTPDGSFVERLMGRRVLAPYPGTIEMVYMTQQPTAKDIWLPVLVLRRDDTGELASVYVNNVRIEPFARGLADPKEGFEPGGGP